jgi:hypothetical protein
VRILRQFPSREGMPEPEGPDAGWQVGRHTLVADEAVAVLRQMIAEDQEHDRRPPRPFDSLSREEQIEELVYQLRDQRAEQWSDPGSCCPFGDAREGGSPAHRLVKYGHDAVPRLIAALDDRRFTRCIGWHRSFYFSHYLLRVGDCAEAVLAKIAGRIFWQSRSTSGAMVKDGEAEAARRKVVAWWESLRARGEVETLAEAVRAGDRDAIAAACTLAERHPEAALPALRAGAEKAGEEWVRAALVEQAGKVPGDEALAFLREHLRQGPLQARVAAAQGLFGREPDDAVAAMIEAWRGIDDPDGGWKVLEFLIGCRRVEAVRAVAEALPRRAVSLRLAALDQWHFGAQVRDSRPTSPETEDAFDDLLAALLDDREVVWGMSGTRLGKSIRNPRLCDLAADHLARRLGSDLFDLEATRRDRDRQLVEVANLWRSRRGLPPLPLPATAGVRLPADRAWQVATATLLPGSAALPPTLRQTFDSLPGRLLDAAAGYELLMTSLRTLPPDAVGVELSIDRDSDPRGAAVEFRLLPRTRSSSERPTWGRHGDVVVGGKLIWAVSGGSAYRHGLTDECWRDFAEALRTALAAPPEVSVSVRVHVTTEQGFVRIAED